MSAREKQAQVSDSVAHRFESGNIVVVHRQPEARNGDIVVARLGQEVTLKRYEQVDAHRVELSP